MTPDLLPTAIASKVVVSPSGCWIWVGAHSGTGYGTTQQDGRPVYIHRYVYDRLVAPIPDGLQIDHLCLLKTCCNPAHLEPVTIGENKRRWAATLTHCKNGHEWTEESTYYSAKGHRDCRPCRATRARAARAKAAG